VGTSASSNRWRISIGILLAAFIAILVAGCGGGNGTASSASNESTSAASEEGGESNAASSGEEGGGSNETEGVEVAFANLTSDSALFASVEHGAKTAAEGAGMTLKTYDNEFDPQKTLNNAQTIAQSPPDVVVEYPPTPEIGKSLYTTFERAGIPCIGLNIPVEGCPWLNIVNQSLGEDAGHEAVAAAKKRGWNGENTMVLLLGSATAGEDVNNTVGYFYSTISEELPGFEKTSREEITATTTKIGSTGLQVESKGTLQGGYTAVKNVLPSIPAGTNIMMSAVNDDAALGGLRALDEAGRGKNSIIVGQGGSKEALEQVRKNPEWVSEVTAFLPVWGYYAMAEAAAIADGVEVPEFTELPHLAVTAKTVDDYYAPGSEQPKKLPPLPAKDAYLKGYGILESYKG
jgi:ribose transport system substrate-binding protein